MTKEVHHVGLYQWTDADGNLRPTRGSIEAERREEAHQKYLEAARKTPEYQEWLKRHGFTK
jgi:hypothetical protein